MRDETPRPEHPRPDFERRAWQNLNGTWQFAPDPTMCGLEKGWATGTRFPMEIKVPFCPESKLGGLEMTDFLGAVWYRRTFTVERALRGLRLLLHFGAVDYDARVWVNGRQVVKHRGGYTPFSADITDAVDMTGENELVVYAVDDERSHNQPLGKQSDILKSQGCCYTRTTGVWQTVWLEAVPEAHVSGIAVWPDALNGQAVVEVEVASPGAELAVEAVASVGGEPVAEATLARAGRRNVLVLRVPDPVLWEVGKPFLYDLRVRLLAGGKVIDEVSSYFGLREVLIQGDRILINRRPVFQRMVLDQGFWPDGIYTAPSDEELRADIERSIACGFHGARFHQKVFEPRSLYWADKLGYIVWGEFADWGCSVRTQAQARENQVREWIEVMQRDRSHPSIVAWTPMNEAYSPYDRYEPTFITELYELTKRLDPTRPVIDTSGYTHVKTDIWDLHDCPQDPAEFRERYARFAVDPLGDTLPRKDPKFEPPYGGQPVVVSEYGGTWWSTDPSAEGWGYGDRPAGEQEFLERFRGLTDVLLDHPHIAGLCYTQLTDVEQERNGLYTYDRKPKFPTEFIRSVLTRKAAIEQ